MSDASAIDPVYQKSCDDFKYPDDDAALDPGIANGGVKEVIRKLCADEETFQLLCEGFKKLISPEIRKQARNEFLNQILGGGSVDDIGNSADVGDRALALAYAEQWHDANGDRLTLEIVRRKIFNKKTGRFGMEPSGACKRLADLTAALGAKK